MRLARRLDHIEPFYVMECAKAAARARASPACDAATAADDLPEHRRARLHRAAAGARGRRALRCATAARSTPQATGPAGAARAHQRLVRASASGSTSRRARIVVTAGASAALQLACLALVDAGDEVLMPDPSYPCNRHFVAAADGVPVLLPGGPRATLPARRRRRRGGLDAAHARRAAGLAVQPDRHLDRARRDGPHRAPRCARAAASRSSTRSTSA